jgi:hypothetical protein
MPRFADVAEYWTESGAAVVVTADSKIIAELVEELGLAPESPVSVKCRQLALGLWGEDLAGYLRLRRGRSPNTQGVPDALRRITLQAVR